MSSGTNCSAYVTYYDKRKLREPLIGQAQLPTGFHRAHSMAIGRIQTSLSELSATFS